MSPSQWQLTFALVERQKEVAFDEYMAAMDASSQAHKRYMEASQLLSVLRSECDAVNAEKGTTDVVAEDQLVVQAVA
jgi:hypothetical protein